MSRFIARGISLVIAATAVVSFAPTVAEAQPGAHFGARDDSYRTRAGIPVAANVLRNDPGATAVVRHTEPAHGTVAIDADGALRYAPAAGFHGTDTFTYTVSDAVRLYQTHLAPLATIGGGALTGGGFGSAVTPVPGHPDQVYGLTDRGPNVDGPDGTKIEPLPGFRPRSGGSGSGPARRSCCSGSD